MKVCDWTGRSATALRRRDFDQSGVAAMSVVVTFVALGLPFKIALVPNQSLIEIFAPDGADQSFGPQHPRNDPKNRTAPALERAGAGSGHPIDFTRA